MRRGAAVFGHVTGYHEGTRDPVPLLSCSSRSCIVPISGPTTGPASGPLLVSAARFASSMLPFIAWIAATPCPTIGTPSQNLVIAPSFEKALPMLVVTEGSDVCGWPGDAGVGLGWR
jgi:hypothetical protein